MDNQEILTLDSHLCRYPLLELGSRSAEICRRGEEAAMVYFPVLGVQNHWREQSLAAQTDLYRYLFCAVSRPGARIAFGVCGDGDGIHLFYGCEPRDVPKLQAGLQGLFPGIRLGEDVRQTLPGSSGFGRGIMIGQPGESEPDSIKSEAFRLPVDILCSSMLGSTFSVMVLAERFPDPLLRRMNQNVRLEDQKYSRYLTRTFTENEQRQENRLVQDYVRHLQMAAADLEQGMQEGMWSTAVYYAADAASDCARLETLLKTAWMGNRDKRYQPLHCLPLRCGKGCGCICSACLSAEMVQSPGTGVLDLDSSFPNSTVFNGYRYRTALTATQLAAYFQMPRHEYPGFAVDPYVEFDTARRMRIPSEKAMTLGNIIRADQCDAPAPMENPYLLHQDDLTRHLLVVGVTGGGKSNTGKALLREITRRGQLPFLVIESAKREYHQLINLNLPGHSGSPLFSRFNLFTMGDENEKTGIPYRLNPFEVMPGASIQTHIRSLLSAFNAAFDLFAPLPQVLEKMVHEVYEDRGWDLTTNRNRFGLTAWPTLTDLYYKIDDVTNRQGYFEEQSRNIKAALRVRIDSLRTGSKGAMLDVPRSIPLETLLNTPTVLELEDLGDDNTRAFVIGMLMVQLYEYRKQNAPAREIRHLLVVEEAHRILRKVPETEGNQTRAESVRFFCDMLSEIRAYGQGIMICDQVPTRLAEDALKNTNCKIVHRTVAEDDRTAVGRAMHMTDPQVDFLASLPRGCAAVYSEGDSRPKLVRFPLVEQEGTLSREAILTRCRAGVKARYADAFRVFRHSHACRYCEQPGCAFRQQCLTWLSALNLKEYWSHINSGEKKISGLSMVQVCRSAEKALNITMTQEQELCFIGLAMQRFPLTPLQQAEILASYIRERGRWYEKQQNPDFD